MRRAKRLAFTAALFSGLLAAQDRAQDIRSLLQKAHEIGVFNGNAFVGSTGKVIYEGSFGYTDASRNALLTSKYRFYIGSISKEFNGAGILLLCQEGALKLDDKLSKYVEGLPPWSSTVEVGHLLNYTSGIPDVPVEQLPSLKDLAFRPGTAFLYTLPNVDLQKKIIEKITGVAYPEFEKTRLFAPCLMANDATGPIASAFDNLFSPVKFEGTIEPEMVLTARDLHKWMNCLNDGAILKGASLEKLAEGFAGNESSLGSAQVESGRLTIHQHQGSGNNYEALAFGRATDGVDVILMTNNQNFKLFQLRDAILAIIDGKPYDVPKKSIYLDIRQGLDANFEEGMVGYLAKRESGRDIYDFASEPFDLINAGKYLMRRRKFDDAIAMFHLSTTFTLKPADLSYAYELIADCYSQKGSKAMTVFYFRKAVEVDTGNKSARGKLAGLIQK
jgi:CubicO group peptidase (beta-lactamase class C family)